MARSLDELRAGPRDRDAFLVYADWLQARGHPRGELIALMDRFEHTADGDEYLRLRRRASEHLVAHPELLPPAPPEPERAAGVSLYRYPPRSAWANWRLGFVRSLDLVFNGSLTLRESSELLAKIVRHPSMALVEHLMVEVDMRGEPLDETEAARSIVLPGLTRWIAELGPGPRPRLDLWTDRRPAPGQREALRGALSALRPTWFSFDLTVVPPAPNSLVGKLLEQQDQSHDVSGWFGALGHFGEALAWFDALGHFDGRGPPRSDSAWRPAVRRLAEGLGPRILGDERPLERRVVDLLGGLAPWMRSLYEEPTGERAMSLAVLEPERLAADELHPDLLSVAAGDPSLAWARVRFSHSDPSWEALVGVGEAQALALFRPDFRRRS